MFDSLKKEHIVAGDGFNRWKVPPASIAIHLCIGSVYAWSIFNPRLTKEFGVVAASANDWNLPSVVWIFSVAIVFLGLAAAFGGKSAHMMKPADAERLTGYKVGGISPFGQKKQVPTAIEELATLEDEVFCNGGQRGLQIRLKPDDLLAALGGKAADLIR